MTIMVLGQVRVQVKFSLRDIEIIMSRFIAGTLTNLRNKKKAGVKPLSVKDEKILNHAIDYANEISAR